MWAARGMQLLAPAAAAGGAREDGDLAAEESKKSPAARSTSPPKQATSALIPRCRDNQHAANHHVRTFASAKHEGQQGTLVLRTMHWPSTTNAHKRTGSVQKLVCLRHVEACYCCQLHRKAQVRSLRDRARPGADDKPPGGQMLELTFESDCA